MTGFVAPWEVEAQFDGAALLVNTSIDEGFPNTFLQAWSRGMPTVSFFDPQLEVAGEAVGAVAADLAAMRQRIDVLLRDRALWQRTGERARRAFEQRHSLARSVDDYERLFEDALAQRHGERARATA
jgi:glycosyltransferase involved in cell wall biosynthesis